jgi:hypothetical protein
VYLKALRAGALPQARPFAFMHAEPHGVWAIDQKGGHGKGLAETRFYVYPDGDTETLYHITIGDKQSQPDDIKFCSEFVADLRRQKELKQNEPAKTEEAEPTEEGGEGEEVS